MAGFFYPPKSQGMFWLKPFEHPVIHNIYVWIANPPKHLGIPVIYCALSLKSTQQKKFGGPIPLQNETPGWF